MTAHGFEFEFINHLDERVVVTVLGLGALGFEPPINIFPVEIDGWGTVTWF